MDLSHILNYGMSSTNPQINAYCKKTIADIMRGNYDENNMSTIIFRINMLSDTQLKNVNAINP